MNAVLMTFLAAVVMVLAVDSTGRADPATRPADGDAAAPGDVRVQSLKGYSYAFVSTQTSLNSLQTAISTLMPKIDAAVDAGKLRPRGPYVFTYHTADNDPSKKFTFDIGVIVNDGAQPPEGIQIVKVPPQAYATILCVGPVSKMGQTYGKLFGEIGRRGLQPSGLTREFYLYWEDAQSANNIVQVQAELAPSN